MIYWEKPEGFTPDFVAAGCFIEVNGFILLLLRAENSRIQALKWATPAGRFATGETAKMAVWREVNEEIGLASDASFLEYLKESFVDYGTEKYIYHMFKMVLPFRVEIRLSPEHSSYVWIPPKLALSSLPLMEDQDACIKYVYGL